MDMREYRQLKLAVFGEYEMNDHPDIPEADLLHRVGEMRRRIQDAHDKLDTLGAPRDDGGNGTLTLSGRIDALHHEGTL